MSIYAIEELLREKPTARVLVIAHDTNILLYNYTQRLNELNVSFEYSTDVTSKAQVHITIPQNAHKIEGQYELLVVDEAHENYLAPRLQDLIKKIKPSKEILLTGTPSKFIKEGGYNIYTLALNDLPQEDVAKINIELIASEYNWFGNYNNKQNVKSSFQSTSQATRKTLENILPSLLKRARIKSTAKRFNFPNILTKAKSWIFAYKSLGKTMIICNTIQQADMVHNILSEKRVDSVISHSENDKDSEQINDFIHDSNNVLIVVDRGRLGYNNTELINIIDLSGTHNPDLIYQMICRVSRPSKKEDEKLYIKVTPKNKINMELTHMSVCAGLMLSDKKYIMKYDGTNFNQLTIPVIKQNRNGGGKKNTYNKNKTLTLPSFTHDVINVLKNIIYDMDKPLSIYESTTVAHVKNRLGISARAEKCIADLFKSAAGNEVDSLDVKKIIETYNS